MPFMSCFMPFIFGRMTMRTGASMVLLLPSLNFRVTEIRSPSLRSCFSPSNMTCSPPGFSVTSPPAGSSILSILRMRITPLS